MSNKRTFVLVNPQARKAAASFVFREAPEGFTVTVQEPKRNNEQNDLLHALIDDIAASHRWVGQRWDAEVWKRILIAAWARTRNEAPIVVPALDGQGVDVVYRRSSELTKAECTDLIEYIYAWSAENAIQPLH